MNSKEDSLSDIKRSGSMNLRSKRDSSKHDFACADTPVNGVPAARQLPELDERHPGKCNKDVEAGASTFHNGTRIGGELSNPDEESNTELHSYVNSENNSDNEITFTETKSKHSIEHDGAL